MDPDTGIESENKQTPGTDNPDNTHTIQGDNHKPIKDISTKTTTKKPRAIKRNRALLEARFPAEYIRQGMNATKTYKALKPSTTYATANVEGTKTLAKPSIQEALHELLKENDMKVRDIVKIHKRNMIQDKDLSTSQRAVQDGYKLYCLLNNDNKGNTTVNIALITKE